LSPNVLRRSSAALVVVVVGVLLASPATAQTSSGSWTQYQGSATHAGAVADGPQPPFRERWTIAAPDGTALSGAVISGNVAIAMDQHDVYGFDLATGDVSWSVDRAGGPLSIPAVTSGAKPLVLFLDGGATTPSPSTSTSASPSASASSGASTPSPSPTVSGGGDAQMSLVAVSLQDQKKEWRAPIPAETRTGVTVDGDTAYVGDTGGTITAVSTADGAVRWSAETPGRIDVPLAASEGIVVAVARDVDARSISLAGFKETDGSAAWPPQQLRVAATTASAPAVLGDAIVVGMPDRLVHDVSLTAGTERWTSIVLSVFSPVTSPAVVGSSIYVADIGGGLYALDASDGSRRWTYQFNDLVLRSAPVRSGRYVLLGLQAGRLVAVDDATGHLAWESAATPGLVGALAVGGDVVVAVKGGNDAGLIAFEPDPNGHLIDEPSPTELDAGTTFGRIGAAAAIALVLVLVPGILSRRRFGDAFTDAGGPEDDG